MTKAHSIQGEHFQFHTSGGVFWEEENMLLIADVHLGKAAHFRKNGMAVPDKINQTSLNRLEGLCQTFKAATICFLGDLFHSEFNHEWEAFKKWAETCNRKLILIKGNHDILPAEHFELMKMKVLESLSIRNFYLTHHPEEHKEKFNICGHIHPGIRLKGPARQTLKLACFFQETRRLILPSFGEFTGNFTIKPGKNDQVFAITPDEVILVS
ncbi:ligase-associated DNA damage response endonuclease PdeM [Robertkochia solimangrovi]|uniref:ligase-associated DNA damage response endonuclease PdeM n=1 Tax=Robertkochia solimangrovi TaxID=2213046 RepID=UPI00117C08F3|nr:ligase-associated DNA damage response endonuclease PdeM [Robertkochia solimangrovi]TRZ46310.1 ligase-associated DNA damage response endonuclease PdeM [Robertkochia solimangrovi]